MKTFVQWTRVIVAVALGILFLKAQGGSSAPKDLVGDEARESAYAIVDAVERLLEDCPDGKLAAAIDGCEVLLGPGVAPRRCPATTRPWSDLLRENGFGVQGWTGPYLEQLVADPWGQSYVITVEGFADQRRHVWVISAGPNGKLDTGARDGAPHGDDVAILAHW